ncbi:glycosyltransferase family 4 protein [Patescibacteria group bacterium]|nr:glycosyltransferase family 4 protein [Patescibacteria group bacterium]
MDYKRVKNYRSTCLNRVREMRTILYSPAGKVHPVEWNLINYPPEGYQFIVQQSKLGKLVNNSFIFDNIRLQILDKLVPLNLVKGILDSRNLPDMPIYSYNHIVRGKSYILHAEWASILIGRNNLYNSLLKNYLRKELEKEECKKILTWTNLASASLVHLYGTPRDKIVVLPPCVPGRNIERDYSKDKIKILFIGSANQSNDFEEKGGNLVLKVFAQLRDRYQDRVELVIKAKVPRHSFQEGVTIINGYLPSLYLENLYRRVDIFFLPTLLYQNTSVIEAASYGLPIVTTSIGSAFEEYLEDEVSCLSRGSMATDLVDGILYTETTERSKKVKRELLRGEYVEEGFFYDLCRLIEETRLRKFLGENAKEEVDFGKFSISNRNKKLKEIFDEALGQV